VVKTAPPPGATRAGESDEHHCQDENAWLLRLRRPLETWVYMSARRHPAAFQLDQTPALFRPTPIPSAKEYHAGRCFLLECGPNFVQKCGKNDGSEVRCYACSDEMPTMNRLTKDDIKLLAEHQILVEHLFKKSADGLCNLTFYRGLARSISEDLLARARSLSHEASNSLGVEGDWVSRETSTADALRRHVREMITDDESLAAKEDRICRVYAHLVLDHEDDRSCDEILRGLRLLAAQYPGFPNIPGDGTCS